jgi:hypothetical protein
MRYALLSVTILAMACDHATAPAPHAKSTVAFALHLDSLATQACNVSTARYASARCEVLRIAETAPAAGVAPAPITIVYNATEETWLASVLDSDEVYRTDSLLLNVYDVIAYSDSNLSIVYFARFQLSANDTSFDYSDVLVLSDTNIIQDPQGSGRVDNKWNVQTATLTGSCALVSGLVAEDSLYGGFPDCQAGTASVVLNGNGYVPFVIPPQTIPMVQIVKNFLEPTS